jgi:hypothetical protein
MGTIARIERREQAGGRIEIENFRCFKKLTVGGPTPVNLIVGANNAGKTDVVRGVRQLHWGAHRPRRFAGRLAGSNQHSQFEVTFLRRPWSRRYTRSRPHFPRGHLAPVEFEDEQDLPAGCVSQRVEYKVNLRELSLRDLGTQGNETF